MADREAGRPVTPDTVFAWASVSKTVTGTAAMILYDEGRFELDDDVDDYLPFSVRNPPAATPDHVPSAAHALIVDRRQRRRLRRSYTLGDSPITLDAFVRGYFCPGRVVRRGAQLRHGCPGDVVEYSNIAIGVLGRAIEEIAGMPFDRFCRERVFAPLEMDTTSFRLADLPLEIIAMPYEPRTRATSSRTDTTASRPTPTGSCAARCPRWRASW